MHPISLAYLTAPFRNPDETLRLAAKLGYDYVGLRIAPSAPGGAFSPLIEDADALKRTCAARDETGVGVFDVEIVRIGPGFDAAGQAAFLDVCAALRARAILVAGDDADEARLSDNFAALCAGAAPFGLTCDLEFMPWTNVPDARTAMRVVSRAGAANGRVLIDALHFARSDTSLGDIAAIPPERLAYAQICDAPSPAPTTNEGLIHDARCARLLPGEGRIDLAGLLRHLPADLPLSVEIPNDVRRAACGNEDWARQALEATRALIAG